MTINGTPAGHLNGMRVAELVLVPTSAQAPLCRPARYAEVDEVVHACWDVGGLGSRHNASDCGHPSRSVSGDGGVDGQADDEGQQGVDDGAGGSVCGCVSGGVAWA